MKNKLNSILIMTIFLSFIVNCSFFQTQSADGMFAPGEVNKCITALKKARGEKVKIVALEIFSKYIVIEAQDAAKPENIDSFDYRNGTLSEPSPVKRSEGDSLESQLFDPAEVALDKIPELVNQSREKSQELEGVGSIQVVVRRWNPASQNVQIQVYVSGSRKKATLTADQNGKVTDFKIN